MTAKPARITIFDTTLRDGEQSPGCTMNQQEKLRLADQLDRLEVVMRYISPISSYRVDTQKILSVFSTF